MLTSPRMAFHPRSFARADDFDAFMKERRKMLLTLIATATGHPISEAAESPEEGEELSEELARDSGLTTAIP